MKLQEAVVETSLTVKDAAELFRQGMAKRPLRYKVLKLTYSTPTPSTDPFDALDDSPRWAFAVNADLQRGDAWGLIFCGIVEEESQRRVVLRAGDNRFGTSTFGILSHLVSCFQEKDRGVRVERSEGKV